jgi:hypothetical protein
VLEEPQKSLDRALIAYRCVLWAALAKIGVTNVPLYDGITYEDTYIVV